jgi:hypothetical protein
MAHGSWHIATRQYIFLAITELHLNKGTPYLSFMGRGDFSRPDIGRLKPPLPREITAKISSITFTKVNSYRPSAMS